MKIAYTRPDGRLAIVIGAPKEHVERAFGQLSEDDYRTIVLSHSIPKDATNVVELPNGWQAPGDRQWRNAWHMPDGKTIEVDMDKAREIHRDRIRAARAARLAALDVAYQRADETGDAAAKKSITAEKQALRDAPARPDIEKAQTPEELAIVWPDELK